jgi:hypothetical protein
MLPVKAVVPETMPPVMYLVKGCLESVGHESQDDDETFAFFSGVSEACKTFALYCKDVPIHFMSLILNPDGKNATIAYSYGVEWLEQFQQDELVRQCQEYAHSLGRELRSLPIIATVH